MTGTVKRYEIQDQWCRQIPLLHRILAKSALSSEFPLPSLVSNLEESCAVWEALHYLLKYLLGWDCPASGLRWWYQRDQPVADSDLLRTVSEIWDCDNTLDFYAAWAWSSGDPTVLGTAIATCFPDPQWWEEFHRRPKPNWPNPFYGGENPLHLGHSDWLMNDEQEDKPFELYHDATTRQAVLIVNNIGNWRQGLQHAESRLPDHGNRSWHVRVFDRQCGYLGTFRRSRVTGRWFQGKHSIHMVGNISLMAEE